jgi:hypothetical protein
MTTDAAWWQAPAHLLPVTANGRQPATIRAVPEGHRDRG